MLVEIRGRSLPGRRCGTNPDGSVSGNIHVGIRKRSEAIELVPGDAPAAAWTFDVTTRITDEGGNDFRGPFVHGKRGERCLYLQWGTVDDAGSFSLFRAAKLLFSDVDPALVSRAQRPGALLVGTLGLTDAKGYPRCARVRPPDIEWSVADGR